MDFLNKNKPLNEYFRTYEVIERPIRLVEDSPIPNFICDLRNNVFSKDELLIITKATSYLEREGNNVERSKNKLGTRMTAFGMRYASGDLGRYKHRKKDCYKVSEELATFISKRLKCIFPTVFEQLEKIKEGEGFVSSEASIGFSPFTSFSITRDYNCKPHIDKDDYDLGFIIWIQEGGDPEGNYQAEFVFPEVKLKFYPCHGDVLILKPNSTYHCTRRLQAQKKQLGVAFFQKASLFRQLSKLKQDKYVEIYDDEKEEKIKINIKDYEQKRKIYIQEREGGQISLSTL